MEKNKMFTSADPAIVLHSWNPVISKKRKHGLNNQEKYRALDNRISVNKQSFFDSLNNVAKNILALFLTTHDLQALGQTSQQWKRKVYEDKYSFQWIKNSSLFLATYVRKIIFKEKTKDNVLTRAEYLSLVKIEEFFNVKIFPSSQIVCFKMRMDDRFYRQKTRFDTRFDKKFTSPEAYYREVGFKEIQKQFPILQTLDMQNCELDQDEIIDMKDFSNLKRLNLAWSSPTNWSSSTWLLNLPPVLQYLSLDGYKITNTSVAQLSHCITLRHTLRALYLEGSSLTDAGLSHLTCFTLRTLQLPSSTTDVGLSYLSNMTTLRNLNLEDTLVSDVGLAYLTNLSKLKRLSIRECEKITDDGLLNLNGINSLNALDLTYCKITDNGILNLIGLASLQILDLSWCTQLTDKVFLSLHAHPKLQVLNLYGSNFIKRNNNGGYGFFVCNGFISELMKRFIILYQTDLNLAKKEFYNKRIII